MEGTRNLEMDLVKLETKVKVQEESLKKKNQKEE